MTEMILKVNGMVCGGCENRVQNAVKMLDGISNVKADHTTGIVKIQLDKDVTKESIIDTIEDIGFDVVKEA